MNKGDELHTFREGGVLWTVNKQDGQSLENALLGRIETLSVPGADMPPEATLIKQNMYRAVYFLRLNGTRGGIYVKRYSVRDWKARLLSRAFPTQAQREWQMMLEMREKGLPVPLPLALGQKREGGEITEYLVTQEIQGGRPFVEAYCDTSIQWDKEALLKALAFLTVKLQKNNVFLRDFQLGNILVNTQSLRPELYLLDLHSAKSMTTLKLQQKIWMLAKLLSSFEPLFDTIGQERFLELCARGMPDFRNEFQANVEKVKALAYKIRLTHIKSRTRRCLKNSTSFTIEDHDGWKVYRRSDFTTKEIFRLLKTYDHSLQEGNTGIKSTSKTHLKILESEKGRVCVKHYWCNGTLDYLKGLVGLSRARRAWVIGNGLTARGVPTAQPYALVEGPEEAFLLSRALTDFPRLDYYILENFRETVDRSISQRKRDLIIGLVQAVRLFHDKRIYHGDLKACNILVEEQAKGTWQFYLIDYDRVIFDSEISLRRRAKNLAQLHTSIPWCISRSDRMRFYREYSKGLELNKKTFLRTVLQFSAGRIPVLMEPIE
ncbi:MAG: lipopolysaccharide kinase InaA family protein [Candidatus Brocadiales bacterium]